MSLITDNIVIIDRWVWLLTILLLLTVDFDYWQWSLITDNTVIIDRWVWLLKILLLLTVLFLYECCLFDWYLKNVQCLQMITIPIQFLTKMLTKYIKYDLIYISGIDINGCPIARGKWNTSSGKWKWHPTCLKGQVKIILWYVQFPKSKMINIELFSVESRGEFYLNNESHISCIFTPFCFILLTMEFPFLK